MFPRLRRRLDSASRSRSRSRSRSIRGRVAFAGLGAAVVLGLSGISTLSHLRPIPPTGPDAVGRVSRILVDTARDEPRTPAQDHREVRLVIWYPAVAGSGRSGPYIEGLDAIAAGLVQSGELSPLEVAGLQLAQAGARYEATPASRAPAWPILILSPGNATNVEFYATLAEELASRGYLVLGVDHPYQVAAVALRSGQVAVYEGDEPIQGPAGTPGASQDGASAVVRRIDERVTDIRFVLDRILADDALPDDLARRVDTARIGILGHSNGGIAAAELCARDLRVSVCLNIDGQAAGGPFSARPNPVPPQKPFMYLTKEQDLALPLAALFNGGRNDTYRVVVLGASHDDFADGRRFEPRLLPFDNMSDRVLTVSRGFAAAFFDHELRGAPQSVLGQVDAPTDVRLEVYPLRPPTG